jgi:hypothetical protein
LLKVENFEWIAEIKLDESGRTSRDRVDHCFTTNLDLALDVEANDLFEPRGGFAEPGMNQDRTPFLNRSPMQPNETFRSLCHFACHREKQTCRD